MAWMLCISARHDLDSALMEAPVVGNAHHMMPHRFCCHGLCGQDSSVESGDRRRWCMQARERHLDWLDSALSEVRAMASRISDHSTDGQEHLDIVEVTISTCTKCGVAIA